MQRLHACKLKTQKISGIKPLRLFIPFPFGFSFAGHAERRIKIIMQKHPKMSLVASAPVCTFTNQIFPTPLQLSPYAFNRYLCKRSLVHKTTSLRAYCLPCGCYVHVLSSGVRLLSTLPF